MSDTSMAPIAVPPVGTPLRKAGFRQRLLRRTATVLALAFLVLLIAAALFAPFVTGYDPLAKDRWLLHFREGLDSVDLTPEQDAKFWDYVTHAAQFMVNTMEDVHPS